MIKKFFIFGFTVAIFTSINSLSLPLQAEIPPEKMKDYSYALGSTMGQGMKRDGLNLNIESFSAGIQDALNGKTKFDEAKIRELMQEFQQAMQEQQRALIAKLGAANAEAGKKFLEENAKKTGVKTTPSGLQYLIEKPGSEPKPKATDVVTVNYRGTLIDGTEFDSTYARGEPSTFVLNRVIPGLTEGLQLIGPGGKIRLFIPSHLAHGDSPAGTLVGPNSTLIFDVELLNVSSAEDKD